MPGGSRNRTPSWWEATAPTTGPTGSAATIRGIRFQVTSPGRIFGMRYYSKVNDANQAWAALRDFSTSDNNLLAMRQFANPPGNESARWRNVWFHPAPRVVTLIDYEALVFFPLGGYFRTIDRLNPVNDRETNGIDVQWGVTLSNLSFITAALTTSTDCYGVDVLFMPDNYTPLAYP